jgi:hypothetical protein
MQRGYDGDIEHSMELGPPPQPRPNNIPLHQSSGNVQFCSSFAKRPRFHGLCPCSEEVCLCASAMIHAILPTDWQGKGRRKEGDST